MPLTKLRSASKKTVGTKQTIKAIEKGIVQVVYIADDADKHMLVSLVKLCREKNVPIMHVPLMDELGKACGIQVGAATAAVLE